MERMDLRVCPVFLARWVPEVSLVPEVSTVFRDPLVFLALRDLLVLKETRDQQDPQDHPD